MLQRAARHYWERGWRARYKNNALLLFIPTFGGMEMWKSWLTIIRSKNSIHKVGKRTINTHSKFHCCVVKLLRNIRDANRNYGRGIKKKFFGAIFIVSWFYHDVIGFMLISYLRESSKRPSIFQDLSATSKFYYRGLKSKNFSIYAKFQAGRRKSRGSFGKTLFRPFWKPLKVPWGWKTKNLNNHETCV